MTFSPGDFVRCERTAPSKGTWKRWVGKEGIVVSVNKHEVGVQFGSTTYWFLPSDLVEAV